MNAIPHLVLGGVLLLAAACSSSNTGMSSGSTSGSSTGTSSSMGSGSTSSSTATSTMSTPMGTGSISNSGSGATGSAGTGDMAGSTGTAGTSGTAAAADMTAFMATFATMPDPTFLMTAASSNLLEIQMGQMATQKSTNADVKRFGQMMVDHHTKATQELKTVASPLGVTLPQTLMPVHQALADRLMGKTGKAFDEDYMDAMEVVHKMDIAMFEVKSKGAETPTVKTFATKTLPMLRSHHTMANEIEKKVD